MKERRLITYEKSAVPAYVLEQLTACTIPSFTAVSFVCEEGRYTGIYETEGYRSLADIQKFSVGRLLQVTCRLLEITMENEKHYLIPGTYVLSMETVFINRLQNQVKLIYLPKEERESGLLQVAELLSRCKEKISEEGSSYIDAMIDVLHEKDMSYRRAVRQGELLQQEIYACDIQ